MWRALLLLGLFACAGEGEGPPVLPDAPCADADGDGFCDDNDHCEGVDTTGDPDGDGICSDLDPCPLDGLDDSDGDGSCDGVDLCMGDDTTGDRDNDRVCDDVDPCPDDRFDDSDGDESCDADDLCEGDDRTGDPDADGICTDVDLCRGNNATGDRDGDKVCDDVDPCPDDRRDDSDGDGSCDGVDPCVGDDSTGDSDGDGVCDSDDVCPLDLLDDSDMDGSCDTDDLCEGDDTTLDSDGDGVCDDIDPCPADTIDDADDDGVCDSTDRCVGSPNRDADSDGICDSIDVCDGDDAVGDRDGDGVCDDIDPCPRAPRDDHDADGTCDNEDLCWGDDSTGDTDGDGFCDDILDDHDGDGCANATDDEPLIPSTDDDADGFAADCDCDDAEPLVVTPSPEICDGIDNDCAGGPDEWVVEAGELIADAISQASDGDHICIGPGTYVERPDVGGRDLLLWGTSGSASTIIDGDGNGPILRFDHANIGTVRGLTLTNSANEIGVRVEGGSDMRFEDVVISGNTNDGDAVQAVGLVVRDSTAHLQRVRIRDNTVDSSREVFGVALRITDSEVVLDDVIIEDNTVLSDEPVWGVGLVAERSTLTATDLVIRDNHVTGAPSVKSVGTYLLGSTFHGRDLRWQDNGCVAVACAGLGLHARASTLDVADTVVLDGVADADTSDGVGVWLYEARGTLRNTVIAGNRATLGAEGVGLRVDYGNALTLTQLTVYGNGATGLGSQGVGLRVGDGGVALHNSTVGGNTSLSEAGTQVYADTLGVVSLDYCNVHGSDRWFGASAGPTTLNLDPRFTDTSGADAAGWDLTLSGSSPLRDAGDPLVVDGDGSRSDIGHTGGPP